MAATGGRNQYRVSSSDSEAGYFTSFAGGNDNPTYGVLDVTVTESVLRASFVRAAGGTHTDTFSIKRRSLNREPAGSRLKKRQNRRRA